jgi:splicing factor 45
LNKKPNNNKNAKGKANTRPNTFVNMHKVTSSTSTSAGDVPAGLAASDAPPAPGRMQKRVYDDWVANDDEDIEYRPQQNRNAKKSKKNFNKKGKNTQQQTWTYDDIYDPSVAVNLVHYPKSDAAFYSKEAWKMRLYTANKKERHRLGQPAKGALDPDILRRVMLTCPDRPTAKEFAPSTKSMFAPPPELTSVGDVRPQSSGSSNRRDDSDRDYDDKPRTSFAKPSFAPPTSLAPPPVNLNKEETAAEAYARRLALSSGGPVAPSPPVSVPEQTIPTKTVTPEQLEQRAKVAQQIAAKQKEIAAKAAGKAAAAKLTKPVPVDVPVSEPMLGFVSATAPERHTTMAEDLAAIQSVIKQPDEPAPDYSFVASGYAPDIVGAPTYNLKYFGIAPHVDDKYAPPTHPGKTAAPAADAEVEADEPSKRPGQVGFAERLLTKMGWEKGQGLGASNDGITSAIVMKADKSKKRPIGKIVSGGKKKVTDDTDQTQHGNMSEVIKFEGMLDGLDVDKEIAENNLLQEIGDEMGDAYGKVERLFIWRGHMGGNEEVFVKFTSQLSALRAVRGMDGTEFAGNLIKGRFWDTAKFEEGEYD